MCIFTLPDLANFGGSRFPFPLGLSLRSARLGETGRMPALQTAVVAAAPLGVQPIYVGVIAALLLPAAAVSVGQAGGVQVQRPECTFWQGRWKQTVVWNATEDKINKVTHPPCCSKTFKTCSSPTRYKRPDAWPDCGCMGAWGGEFWNGRHVWVPEPQVTCPSLRELDSHTFCRLLGGRNLTFIGDSLMGQTYAAVFNTIHVQQPAAPCLPQLGFIESDTLIGESFGAMNRGHSLEKMKLPENAVVLINVGHHVRMYEGHEVDWKHEEVLEHIYEKLAPMIRKQQAESNVSFVWRSMTPGHLNCSLHVETGPFTDYSQYNVSRDEAEHGVWTIVDDMDKFWKARMRQLRIPVADVKPLELRPDAHVLMPHRQNYTDCLHWGGPIGALQFIAKMVQHLLEHYIPHDPAA